MMPIGGVMTELRVEYVTRINTVVTWCRCPNCNTEYGYETDNGAFLRIGSIKVKSMHAECGKCGNPIWWYASDRHIRKISERSADDR